METKGNVSQALARGLDAAVQLQDPDVQLRTLPPELAAIGPLLAQLHLASLQGESCIWSVDSTAARSETAL